MSSPKNPRPLRKWLSAALLLGAFSCGDPSANPGVGPDVESRSLALPSPPEGALLDPGVALAIDSAQAEVRRSPKDAGVRFELGMTFDANSLHEAAREAYEQTIQLDPKHARAHYNRARMLRELGRLKESRVSLDHALELAPDYASAHRRSADWFVQAGDLDMAAQAYSRVRELQPDWPDGKLGLAHLALLREQPERAEGLARDVISSHPDSSYARHLLGCALRDLGRTKESEEAFARAAGGVPLWRDPWVDEVESRLGGSSRLMVEAKACLEQGLFEEACKRLAILHEQSPDDVTVQGMWTAALTNLSRHAEALEMLLAARSRQADHFRIELNLAIVRWKQGELDLAVDHLERAVELNPGHEAVYMVQGRVLSARQDPKGAIQAFEKALSLGTEPGRVLPRIGQLQMGLQDWSAAAEAYRRAALAMPQNASVHATLAGCLVEAGDREGARAAIASARAIDPNEKLLPMILARIAELDGGK